MFFLFNLLSIKSRLRISWLGIFKRNKSRKQDWKKMKQGFTYLDWAVQESHPSIVRLLLSMCADEEAKDTSSRFYM